MAEGDRNRLAKARAQAGLAGPRWPAGLTGLAGAAGLAGRGPAARFRPPVPPEPVHGSLALRYI